MHTRFSATLFRRSERRRLLMIVSGALLLGGLLLSHFVSDVVGDAVLRDVLFIASALTAGSDIAVRAWRGLWARHISIELLVMIAAVGGIAIGIHLEAAAVTFLFLLGAYLEERTIRRTRRAIGDLLAAAPTTAILIENGASREVPAATVSTGATVRVLPGARVPVDGTVLGGHSSVDESAITGESLPAEKWQGERVFAGTINHSGVLDVRAESAGADTTLARIIHQVEEAQEARLPVQRSIERFARWYTPAMIAAAVVLFAATGNIIPALTLLVIACPGALVIATPVAVAASIGRAARGGLMIRGGERLEAIGRTTAVVLDKTGTLTKGQPEVAEVIPVDGMSSEADVLRWAAIAESDSSHPLALPIVAAARETGDVPMADSGEAVAGMGIRARNQSYEIVVGRRDFLESLEVDVPYSAAEALHRLEADGVTAVCVAVDGRAIGVIGVADALRPSSTHLREALESAGVKRIVMATGDAPDVAQAIARRVGITDVRARLMPSDKLEIIRALQAEGHVVAFAGDGINDAPGLAAADVGISMGSHAADVAVEAADITILSDDITALSDAISTSRRTTSVIRQNLGIAIGTVALLIAGVFGGLITMGGGMLIHEASVLLVVVNSLRLLRGRTRAPQSVEAPADEPQDAHSVKLAA
jgi:Zn2+/Cd2+-exporting ATPase